MGHPPIEKLLLNAGGSVYKLSRLAAKRAADLASGRKPLVECDSRTKTATIALEEILCGMVVLKEGPVQKKREEKDVAESSKADNDEVEE